MDNLWVTGTSNLYIVDSTFFIYSQGSMTTAEWRIDHFLNGSIEEEKAETKTKEHTLAVQVLRWCDGSYLVLNSVLHFRQKPIHNFAGRSSIESDFAFGHSTVCFQDMWDMSGIFRVCKH